jgi:hypothetical protein
VHISFNVAERVVRFGVIPKSLTSIENGEASYYVPQDIYRVDDIFWIHIPNHVHNVTYRCEHGYAIM